MLCMILCWVRHISVLEAVIREIDCQPKLQQNADQKKIFWRERISTSPLNDFFYVHSLYFILFHVLIVFATVYLDTDQRKLQSSASLSFEWGIHRRPVNSPHKWPVMRKMFPFDDVIMLLFIYHTPEKTYPAKLLCLPSFCCLLIPMASIAPVKLHSMIKPWAFIPEQSHISFVHYEMVRPHEMNSPRFLLVMTQQISCNKVTYQSGITK